MNTSRKNFFEYLAVTAVLFTFFAYFSVRIWDIDFWWHIAAGREMVASGAIPSQDPFGVYDAANNWGQTVLRGQWLGQVLLYAIYRAFDFDGIIIFRALVLTLSLGVVYWRCCLLQVGLPWRFGLLALTGLAVLSHTGERPQLFSFLALSLLCLLLDGYARTSKRWLLYCVPAVFLFWANSHGAVIFGEVVLLLFAAGHCLQRRSTDHPLSASERKLWLVIVGLSLLALVIAPNGLTTLKYIAFSENRLVRDRMSEYTPPWSLWPATQYYWAFFVVALLSLGKFFNRDGMRYLLLILPAALLSVTAYRYIPMFALLAAPYIALGWGKLLPRLHLSSGVMNAVAIVLATASLGYGIQQGRVWQHGVQEDKYPAAAMTYIQQHHLSGKVFNTMTWGGYLTWHLAPAITVFLDGRVLDPSRIEPYTHILWMTAAGQQFFEQGNFDLVLIPPGNVFTKEAYPLVNYLLNRPDWRLIQQDANTYFFARVTM